MSTTRSTSARTKSGSYRPKSGKARKVKPRPVQTKPVANINPVTKLRQLLNLTQPLFARLLPVSVRSLATLESGTEPNTAIARRLVELQRLTKALAEVMNEDVMGKWLQTPNPAFDGLKPLEVIDRGESDRIWSMIYFLRSGVPS